MSDYSSNAELLQRRIGAGEEMDFRYAPGVTGQENLGDFTSYLRLFRTDVRTEPRRMYDTAQRAVVDKVERYEFPVVPRYTAREKDLLYRPADELGIEVVAKYLPNSNDIEEEGKYEARHGFSIVAARAVEISWEPSEHGQAIYKASAGYVDLAGTNLLDRAVGISMSKGGADFFMRHFMAPYVAHTLLGKMHDSGRDIVILEDEQGIIAAEQVGVNKVVGRLYPAQDNPLTAYWNGGAISTLDAASSGAKQALPGESPFFNFSAQLVTGDRLDQRYARLNIMNVADGEYPGGKKELIARAMMSMVGDLEAA